MVSPVPDVESDAVSAGRGRTADQVARARALIGMFDTVRASGPGAATTAQMDLLRAAVVILHAATEDAVRSALRELLPRCGSVEALDRVPIVKVPGTRVLSVGLGSLREAFGDRSLPEVIQLRVDAMLQESTYNRVAEVAGALRDVGIHSDDVLSGDARTLGHLMRRRHRIAHRADGNPLAGRGHRKTQPIGRQLVVEWATAVERVCSRIFDQTAVRLDEFTP